MAVDADWAADLARYGLKRPFLKEQSIWALWVYRYGRRNDARPDGLLKKLGTVWYWLLFRLVETITGISLPKSAVIGGGLRIWHFGGIFINPGVVMGKNCTLRQGVTIGNRTEGGPVPVIGDEVDFGAYAQVLGDIRLGDRCKIGAMAMVIKNVPADATAVGVPARVITVKPALVKPDPAKPALVKEAPVNPVPVKSLSAALEAESQDKEQYQDKDKEQYSVARK